MNNINFEEVTMLKIKCIKDKVFSVKNAALRWFIEKIFCNFIFKNSQINEIFIDLTKYKLKISDI